MEMKSFERTLDIGVAKYTGSPGPIKLLEGIVKIFSGQGWNSTDEGHFTRTFDWNGYTIWTPCDCHLAANEWLLNTGEFSYRLKSDTMESLATMYVFQCGMGCVFGNGGQLFYGDKNGNLQRLLDTNSVFNIKSINTAKLEGNSILLLKDFNTIDDAALILFERTNASEKFEEHKIQIDKKFFKDSETHSSYRSWNLKYLENRKSSLSYAFMYTTSSNTDLDTVNDLILISPSSKEVLKSCRLSGIQSISKHPGENLLAVLGKELMILSIPELDLIEKRKLPVTRDIDANGAISFSTCGRFIALTYSVNGEVEIRDAQTLDIINVFDGYGRPQPDMSWDITGRYLACRFESRERHNPTVVVWDTKSCKKVLHTESSTTRFVPVAIRWAPNSTKLACLVNNKRIQVFELR
jgi:hypothetical protein